jgi:plasmid stability protein
MAKMIQVRNVPDRLHRELVRRARLRGQTLTDYIQEILDGARGPGPGLGAGRR